MNDLPKHSVNEERVSGGQKARAVAGYVLAGGASSRFGKDKALVEFGGKPMLARMLDVMREGTECGPFIIGAEEKYGHFGVKCVKDRWPGEGPLGGIITALLYTLENQQACRMNLILGCDLPFLAREWLEDLCKRSEKSAASVVVPQSPAGLEPLCACWRTDAVDVLQGVFDRGVRKVTEGIASLRAEVLDEREWKRFDNEGRLFWNMNTPDDYERARRILEKEPA